MPRIISRIIDQYDFEGPPVSGLPLIYDSASGKFKTVPMASFGTVNYIGGSGNVNGITLSGSTTSSGTLLLSGSLLLNDQLSGILPIVKGGTNNSTLGTSGNILYFDGDKAQGHSLLKYTTSGTLTVRQAIAQSADIQQWLDESGRVIARLTSPASGQPSFSCSYLTGSEQFGQGSKVDGPYSVAIGGNSLAKSSGIAIGYGAQNYVLGGIAVGANSASDDGIVIGNNSVNAGTYCITIGHNITNSNDGAIIIGDTDFMELRSDYLYVGSLNSAWAPDVTISPANNSHYNTASGRNLYIKGAASSAPASSGMGGNIYLQGGLHYLGESGGKIIIKQFNSVSNTLQEWQDNNGIALGRFHSSGIFYANDFRSLPVASGAGKNLLITAGSGNISGGGGSVILKAGIQATTGGDGKVIIQQASGQTSNLQEWQNSNSVITNKITRYGGMTFTFYYDTAPSSAGEVGLFNGNGQLIICSSSSRVAAFGTYGSQFGQVLASTAALGWNSGSALSGGNFFADCGFRRQTAGIIKTVNGLTSTAGYCSFVVGSYTAATVGLKVIGATGLQTANLQEWQNSSSGVLTSVGPSGAISLLPYGASAGNTNEIRFVELAANGTEYVGFKAANLIPTTTVWTLPSGEGASGQALTTNGSGLLSWANSSTGTVTSVSGTGTVNGLTLTGTVTNSGAITLGGTLSNISLTTAVSGILPIANGGTNATTAVDALTNLGAYPTTNPSGYTSNIGTVTYVNGTGSVNGLTLTGVVSNSGSITLGGTLSGVSLTSQITGMLPIANGGTNNSSLGSSGNILYFDGAQVQGQSLLTYTPTGIGINSVTPSGALQIQTTSASNKGLIIQGSASQSANLHEWRDSSSNILSCVNNLGQFGLNSGSNTLGGSVDIWNGNYTGNPPLLIGADVGTNTRTNNARKLGSICAKHYTNAANPVSIISADIDGTNNILWFGGGFSGYSAATQIKFATASNTITNLGTTRLTIDANGQILVNGFTASTKGLVVRGAASQTANLQEWQNSAGTPLSYLDASGNFYAVSKSFLIPHPSPEKAAAGRKLRYASLEGPEHAVFFRGNLCNSNQIDLPNYWKDLVHADSINVSLTAKKYAQPNLFVKESNNIKIIIDSDRPINCDYIVYGTRKDVEKLEVETDVC